MPLRNVATTFTIEQQRLEINALAGDVNNIATGVTNVGTAATANALAAGATGADLTLSGTLTVNGTQTILNTATLEVEDKNIVIAKGSTTDAAASGGGITLKGADDKTLLYDQAGDEWQFNKPLRVEGSQGYASSASTLETSVTKAAFRVKGSTDSSDSLWMGVESTDANPYIQGSNGVGNNAKTLLLNPHGGRVGIGKTANAQRTLDIQTESNENGFCLNSIGTPPNYHFDIRDDNDVVLRVDPAGKVGIGTDTPNRDLEVYRDAAQVSIGIIASTTGQSSLWLANTGDINVGGIYYEHDNNALGFRVNDSSDVLRINSDGQVNLGTNGVNKAQFCQAGNNHYVVGKAADNVAALEVYSQHGSSYNKISFGVYDNRTGSKSASFLIRGDGQVEDGIGNLRSIPANNQPSAYSLDDSDAGKCVLAGGQISVPSDVGFVEGDAVTIINNSASAINFAHNSVTLYNTADGTTLTSPNGQLGARGMCTIYFVSNTVAYISGAQLS